MVYKNIKKRTFEIIQASTEHDLASKIFDICLIVLVNRKESESCLEILQNGQIRIHIEKFLLAEVLENGYIGQEKIFSNMNIQKDLKSLTEQNLIL